MATMYVSCEHFTSIIVNSFMLQQTTAKFQENLSYKINDTCIGFNTQGWDNNLMVLKHGCGILQAKNARSR